MNPLLLTPTTLPTLINRLSPRQMDVVEHLAQGLSAKQTAHILSIKTGTVMTYIERACKWTGTQNRTQLVFIFGMWKMLNVKHSYQPELRKTPLSIPN